MSAPASILGGGGMWRTVIREWDQMKIRDINCDRLFNLFILLLLLIHIFPTEARTVKKPKILKLPYLGNV